MKSSKDIVLGNIRNHLQGYYENNKLPKKETIHDAINQFINMDLYSDLTNNDKEDIRSTIFEQYIKENYDPFGDESEILDNESLDHEEWLYESGLHKNKEISWTNWDAYREYLISNEGYPNDVVRNIDKDTFKILMRLEDPKRKGKWARYGMAVGDIQSGKTTNFTALINKAADAGYKHIVVLSGMMNDLRAQTQGRIDYGFTGYDTRKYELEEAIQRKNQYVGVGNVKENWCKNGRITKDEKDNIFTITSNKVNGDVSTHTINNIHFPPNDPYIKIFVCKKNVSVLESLHTYLVERIAKVNLPLLVIDDECDNASLNANKIPLDENGNEIKDHNPTAINKAVRKLINSYSKTSYIGYTATPFANCFISRYDVHDEYGKDLYPRDFIINLNKPSNYIGSDDFFGRDRDALSQLDEIKGIDSIVSVIDDHNVLNEIIKKYKTEVEITDMPDSLYKSIYSFIIACAIRSSRNEKNNHNSMLIHISRYKKVQSDIKELVSIFVKDKLIEAINRSDPMTNRYWIKLRDIFTESFIKTTAIINKRRDLIDRFGHEFNEIIWEDLIPHIKTTAMKISIIQMNGNEKEVLDFKKNAEDNKYLNVICIGGDKLSRGLTLEGLITSYYIRSAGNYDTLLQMGRWFGYKSKYIDICRIYTTKGIWDQFKKISIAVAELKSSFKVYADQGAKPEDWGNKIRLIPNMNVSRRGVLHGTSKRPTAYDLTIIRQKALNNDIEIRKSCKILIEKSFTKYKFKHIGILSKNNNYSSKRAYYNSNIPTSEIHDFILKIKDFTHLDNKQWHQGMTSAIKKSHLSKWSIAIIDNNNNKVKTYLERLDVNIGSVERTFDHNSTDNFFTYKSNNMMDNRDLLLGFNHKEAISGSKNGKIISPPRAMGERSKDKYIANGGGLIIIYAIKPKNEEFNNDDYQTYPLFSIFICFPKLPSSWLDPKESKYLCDELITQGELFND